MRIDLVGCRFEAEAVPSLMLDPNMGAVLSVRVVSRDGHEEGMLSLGVREAQSLKEALERLLTPCP